MGTYSIIPCWEEHGGVAENFSLDKWTASVTLRCAWGNRYLLVNDIIGNSRPFPHSSYAVAPQASSASIVPALDAAITVGQSLDYEYALVTINYSTEVKDLVVEEIEPTTEFIKEDFRRFRWGAASGDPLTEKEAPGRLVRGMNIVRTYYQLASIHPDFLDLVGACNSAQYVSALLGLTFPAQTLLYHPPVINRAITTAGAEAFTLKAKYTYKKGGWNHYWRQKSQDFEQIYDVNGVVYESYPPESFANILT